MGHTDKEYLLEKTLVTFDQEAELHQAYPGESESGNLAQGSLQLGKAGVEVWRFGPCHKSIKTIQELVGGRMPIVMVIV